MPKSKNKRKNGKTRRANGAGGVDLARAQTKKNKPSTPVNIGTYGDVLGAGQIRGLLDSMAHSKPVFIDSMTMLDEGHVGFDLETQHLIQKHGFKDCANMASMLYGNVNEVTLLAGAGALADLKQGVEGLLMDELHHAMPIREKQEPVPHNVKPQVVAVTAGGVGVGYSMARKLIGDDE